jgi:hypothetical protein
MDKYEFYRGEHLDAYAMKYAVHAANEDDAKTKVKELWTEACRIDKCNPLPIPNFTLYSINGNSHDNQ